MDPLAIATVTSAVSGLVLGGAGLWRSRKSDQQDEIADLWTENRNLRAEMRSLHEEVLGLRRDVEKCESAKNALARQVATLGGSL